MRKIWFWACFSLLFPLILSGCSLKENGETLQAFSNRINEINSEYNFNPDGFIFDQSERSLSKFFVFSEENEILLNFKLNEKNRINEMNLVFDKEALNNNYSYSFLHHCIYAFCNNNELTKTLLSDIDFETAIKNESFFTASAESDSIKLLIDTTELGTVITIYKDI